MKKNDFKKRNIFFILLLFIGLISLISATPISEDLHVNIQTTNSTGSVITGTFDFVFNISTSSNCSDTAKVIYNNSVTLTTDSRGIISYYLPNVTSDYDVQYWLCYYRNGTLINSSKIARTPYTFRARNITLSGIEVDSNFDLLDKNITTTGYGFFNYLGSLVDKITKLFVTDINANGSANISGNLIVGTDTLFVNATSGRVGIGTSSPTQKLEVVGRLNLSSAGSSTQIWDQTTEGLRINPSTDLVSISRGGTGDGQLQIWSDSETNKYINFSHDGTDGHIGTSAGDLVLSPLTGNVGIGTTSPGAKLDVKSLVAGSDVLQKWRADDNGIIGQFGKTADDNSYFQLLNGSDVTRVSLHSAGNSYFMGGDVGIGTASPSEKLEIFDGNLLLSNSAETDRGIMFYDNDDPANQYANIIYGSGDNRLKLSNKGNLGIAIDNTGRVGIRTNNPLYTLDVNGTGRFTSSIMGGATLSGTDPTFFLYDTDGGTWNKTSIGQRAGKLHFWDASDVPWETIMALDLENERVGIGTSSPAGTLHVFDSTSSEDVDLRIQDGTEAMIQFSNGTTGYTNYIAYDAATDNLWFGSDDTNEDDLVLDSTGKVGIGTTSPAKTLEVYGDALRMTSLSNVNSVVEIKVTNDSKVSAVNFLNNGSSARGQIMYDFSNEFMRFTTNGSERIRVLADGNVGIGTSSPGEKLHVGSATTNDNVSVLIETLNAGTNIPALKYAWGGTDVGWVQMPFDTRTTLGME